MYLCENQIYVEKHLGKIQSNTPVVIIMPWREDSIRAYIKTAQYNVFFLALAGIEMIRLKVYQIKITLGKSKITFNHKKNSRFTHILLKWNYMWVNLYFLLCQKFNLAAILTTQEVRIKRPNI